MGLFSDDSSAGQASASDSAPQENSKSSSLKRRSADSRAAVGAALRAVLRNIQALEKEFALQALAIFQEFLAGEEDELNIDDTCEALCELGLSAYVDGGEVGDGGAVNIGDGEEARRQLRLWSKSNANSTVFTTDEQCFLWIAWRGRRFVDSADLLWPVFRALDADTDGAIGLTDIERCLQAAAKPVTTFTSPRTTPRKDGPEPDKVAFDANADADKFRAELYELLAYHAGSEGSKALISFAQFIAMICDAQDKFALHRLSLTRPAALMMRYDRGVLFMRPEEVSCFAKPGDQEVIDQATRARDRQELNAVKSDAELALAEARAAKVAAEAATKMVEDYLESPRTLRTPCSAETTTKMPEANLEKLPGVYLESPSTPRTPRSPRNLNSEASMIAQRAAMLRQAAEGRVLTQEAGEQAAKEAEERAAREAKENAASETRKKAAELAAKEAEAIAQREAQERAAREAREKAETEAEARAAKAAKEKAAREAQEKAAREAQEKAAREAQEKAARDNAALVAVREARERAAKEAEELAAKEAQLVAAQKAMEIKRAQEAAAIQMQRGARGHLARKKVEQRRIQKREDELAEDTRLKDLESQRHHAATKIQGVARGRQSRMRVRELKRVKHEEMRLAQETQRAMEEAELAQKQAMQQAELAAARARQEALEAERLREEEEAMRKVFEEEAACQLKAACRSFLAKVLVLGCRAAEETLLKKKRESIMIIQANLRGAQVRKQTRKKKEDATKAKKAEREAAAATRIQARARGSICRNQLKQAKSNQAERRVREDEAAKKMQAHARGSICRNQLKQTQRENVERRVREDEAAKKIQARVRGSICRAQAAKTEKKQKAAPQAKKGDNDLASSTRAHIEFRFENLDYTILTSDKTVADKLIGAVTESLSAHASVDPQRVEVALHPGSVVVQASVECPIKSMARALEGVLSQGDLLARIDNSVARIPGIKNAMGGHDSLGLGGLKVPSKILASEPRPLAANKQQVVADVPVSFKPEPKPPQISIDPVSITPEPRQLQNPIDPVVSTPKPRPLQNPIGGCLAPEERIPRIAGLSMSPPLRFQRDLVMQEASPSNAHSTAIDGASRSPRMSPKVPKLQLRRRGTMQEPKRAPKEESDQSDVDAEEEDLPLAEKVPLNPKLELADFKQEQLELEQRERLAFEQEQLALEQQDLALKQEQLALEEQRIILEQEMERKRQEATLRIQAHARGSICRRNVEANKKQAKQNRSDKKASVDDELDAAVPDNTLQLPDGSVMPPETPPRSMPGETSPREAVMPEERSPSGPGLKEGVMPPESETSPREGVMPTERSPREGVMPPEKSAASPVLPQRRQSEPRGSVFLPPQREERSGSFSGQSKAMNRPSAGFEPLARGPLPTSQPAPPAMQQSLAPLPAQPLANSYVQPVQPYPNSFVQQPVQAYSGYSDASMQQQQVQPYSNMPVQQPVQPYSNSYVQQPVQAYSNEFVQQQQQISAAQAPPAAQFDQVKRDLAPAPEQRYDEQAQVNAEIPAPEEVKKQEDIIGKDETEDLDPGANADDEDGNLDDDDDDLFEEEEEEEDEEDEEIDEEVEAETVEVSATDIKVETPARAEVPVETEEVKTEEVKTGQSPQIPVVEDLKPAENVADKKLAADLPHEQKNQVDEAMTAAAVAVNGGNDDTGLEGDDDDDEDEFVEEEEEEEEDDFEDDVAVQSGDDTPATGTPGSQDQQVTESVTH
eukprot:TRINITY_DN1475_c0_g1_i1.p1 TRINITY_DN1475_c0_g1~~TRINITY_DN1475_c0_g1_i1.p1  ORF type:complete len:1717 (-),score=474.76 TRINITY_DN1475_c0_g1_i1:121-5271(-)